ncbi:membrane-spanning 4-domains subfamily A member 4A-like [Spinachia spinachia]
MADEAAFVEEGIGPAQSPLVAVSFQRNVHRKEKYLEAEPKALGVTQIGLSVFQISCVALFLSKGMGDNSMDIPFFISSFTLIIAGSLAIAAQNLHLPMLRACLGMQIVACGACVFNLICTVFKMDQSVYLCWHVYSDYNTTDLETCEKIESVNSHFFAEILVIQAALFAISVTLAAYCCKVVNCCSPAPKMPVITLHAPPPVQQ